MDPANNNLPGVWVTLPFTTQRIFVPGDNWIGFDLDGTLARTDNPGHFQPPYPLGEPVPEMLAAAKALMAEGVKIKIFTARACEPAAIPMVQDWAEKHGLGRLDVTNQKDYRLLRFYDDRAVPFPLVNTYDALKRYQSAESAALFFDKDRDSDFAELLTRYKPEEFLSPTRSTVPLLSLLRFDRALFQKVLCSIGFPSNSAVHLEYQVKSPNGSGKPSHTDAMVLASNAALAIEAKWTESEYDTVSDWLAKGSSRENRLAVLNGWCQLLRRNASRIFTADELSSVTYQTVHRAASACAAGETAALMYLVFDPLPDGTQGTVEHIRQSLRSLSHVLGQPPHFPFYLCRLNAHPTDCFVRLQSNLRTSGLVCTEIEAVIANEKLFNFGEFTVEQH